MSNDRLNINKREYFISKNNRNYLSPNNLEKLPVNHVSDKVFNYMNYKYNIDQTSSDGSIIQKENLNRFKDNRFVHNEGMYSKEEKIIRNYQKNKNNKLNSSDAIINDEISFSDASELNSIKYKNMVNKYSSVDYDRHSNRRYNNSNYKTSKSMNISYDRIKDSYELVSNYPQYYKSYDCIRTYDTANYNGKNNSSSNLRYDNIEIKDNHNNNYTKVKDNRLNSNHRKNEQYNHFSSKKMPRYDTNSNSSSVFRYDNDNDFERVHNRNSHIGYYDTESTKNKIHSKESFRQNTYSTLPKLNNEHNCPICNSTYNSLEQTNYDCINSGYYNHPKRKINPHNYNNNYFDARLNHANNLGYVNSVRNVEYNRRLFKKVQSTSFISLAAYKIIRTLVQPIESWIGLKILADSNFSSVSDSKNEKQEYNETKKILDKNKFQVDEIDSNQLKTSKEYNGKTCSNGISNNKHYLNNDKVGVTNYDGTQEFNSKEKTIVTRKPINIDDFELVIEHSDIKYIEQDFATITLCARWIIPDFLFLRTLAKQNELPSSEYSNSIASQIFGSEYTIINENGFKFIIKIAFKMRCFPNGDTTTSLLNIGNISIMIECDHISFMNQHGYRTFDIPEDMIGRSLICISLVDLYGSDIRQTTVQHTFSPIAVGKIFSFPKYMTPKNNNDVQEFLNAGFTKSSLVFRIVYKALMTTHNIERILAQH